MTADEIMAMVGREPVEVTVVTNRHLDAVEVSVTTHGDTTVYVMTHIASLDLALQLVGAAMRLRGEEP